MPQSGRSPEGDYYLLDNREKLDREIQAFECMHAELIRQYLAEWVAIHNGQIVEHAPEKSEVARRVRSRFGRAPVLIRQVTESPRRELWFRSPRLERGPS